VARYEGRVVFVRHTLPGEVVVAEVTEDAGGSFCRADAVEVRKAAPGRDTPPCPLADIALGTGRCGGCDWQHVSGSAQRELKSAVLAEQLRRIAGIEREVPVRELPGGLLGWRSRVRLAVDEHGRAGFREHRSHRVIPIEHCPITMPGVVEAVVSERWSPGSELEVVRDATGAVHVMTRSAERRKHRDRVRRELVRGSGVAVEEAAGRSWELAAHGFWQVHFAAAGTFAATVARMAAAPAGGVAWDLYGGAGLFAAVLAGQVGADGGVLLVESSDRAVRDATENLRDLRQVTPRTGRVEEVIGEKGLPHPDVVVLDPPRKGAGRAVVAAITAQAPARIVHVGCDPAALARDIGLYREHGYELGEIEAWDAFPMTHHIECIAVLERASADAEQNGRKARITGL
jgi:tRNA/tmRNA/rRNA uracil-C5-methylase (TrmA/RlmC/RlmD family)